MKRYLLVASLDVKRQPNNRDHHLINHIAPCFSEAWVVYRKRNDQGDHSRRISQLLFASSKIHRQREGLTFLEALIKEEIYFNEINKNNNNKNNENKNSNNNNNNNNNIIPFSIYIELKVYFYFDQLGVLFPMLT